MEWSAVLSPLAAAAEARADRRSGDKFAAAGVWLESGDGPNDDALVARIAAGDRRAFAEIVRRHGGRLKALALRFSGGTAEADDIVQETFWSLWRNARRWRPGGPPFAAYLTRMAMNRAIDGERKRRTRQFFGLEAAEEAVDPSPQTDARIAANSTLAAVVDDIRELPARQRVAILLSADGERTNIEIAAAMGLSVGAVEQLLVRARRTLRARLAERESPGGLGK